jgi:hypothetical protein
MLRPSSRSTDPRDPVEVQESRFPALLPFTLRTESHISFRTHTDIYIKYTRWNLFPWTRFYRITSPPSNIHPFGYGPPPCPTCSMRVRSVGPHGIYMNSSNWRRDADASQLRVSGCGWRMQGQGCRKPKSRLCWCNTLIYSSILSTPGLLNFSLKLLDFV